MSNRAAAAPSWLDEIGADPGPPFLRMGVRALAGAWLLDGADVPDQLAEKRRILRDHHNEAFAALPGTEVAADELLTELVSGTAAHFAQGEVHPLDADDARGDLHPLDAAGRLVAEDLCLLLRHDTGWVLGAGSVCFPSHWRLTEKLRRPVTEIHSPVPHYAAELAGRVDRFLDRLRPARGAWRRNWTVHTTDHLFAPTPAPPPHPPITAADAGERLWFRSEHQTLRRLPRSDAIVFSIRTQQVPLATLTNHPNLCHRLAEAAATWSPDLVAYKGGGKVHQPFVTWLRSSSG